MPYFSAGMFVKLMIMITFQFMSNGLHRNCVCNCYYPQLVKKVFHYKRHKWMLNLTGFETQGEPSEIPDTGE